jgi:PAS domain S-box-containing protein
MRIFQKTSNIFNLLSEGIIVVNTKQVIVATNSSAKEMFSYEKDELIGKPQDILIPSRYHHNHDTHVENFIAKSGKRQMGHGNDLFGRNILLLT